MKETVLVAEEQISCLEGDMIDTTHDLHHT